MDREWMMPVALEGGELDRGRRAGDDDEQLELLDDILALLIDSPAPGDASPAAPNALTAPPNGLLTPPNALLAPPNALLTPAAKADKLSPGGGGSAESSSEHSAREEEDKPATPAAAPARGKKRRKRPKDELDYLRGRVGELEQELQALTTPSVKDLDDEDDKQWMEIAHHQHSQMQDAWATNQQLRTMLEGQLAVAQQLQQALQQHLKLARFEGLASPSIAKPQPPRAADAAGSSALFKSLTEGLDALYARLDEVFVSTNITLLPNKARERSTEVRTDARGAFFESVMGQRMPFTVDAVERALFRSLSLNIASQPYGSTTSVDTNTFNITFSEPLRSGHLPSITFTGKTAMRRYVQGDRVVTIWNSVVEIDGSMYVRLREEGWGVVRADESSTSEHPVTWMQHIVRTRPEVAGIVSPEEQRAHVGEMTDLVLDTYRRLDLKMHQTVENLLIADSITVMR